MRQQTLFEIYEEEHPSKKICTKCKQEKDVSDFYKNKGAKDGFYSHCKVCKKEHGTSRKEYDKKYREKHKEQAYEARKTWRINNPEHVKIKNREYRKNNGDHMRKIEKEYYHKNKIQLKSNTLKHKYNINENTRRQMYKDQDGCCAICGKPQSDVKTKLHIDHNHATGVVRGLLCWSCNLTLGLVKDSPKILQKAIDYLNIYDK